MTLLDPVPEAKAEALRARPSARTSTWHLASCASTARPGRGSCPQTKGNTGPFKTETFRPETEAAGRDWVRRLNETEHHIYFMVNPPMRDLDSKEKKEDVRDMAVLHVDIDPKKGANAPPRSRLVPLRLPRSKRPSTRPHPRSSSTVAEGCKRFGCWASRCTSAATFRPPKMPSSTISISRAEAGRG